MAAWLVSVSCDHRVVERDAAWPAAEVIRVGRPGDGFEAAGRLFGGTAPLRQPTVTVTGRGTSPGLFGVERETG